MADMAEGITRDAVIDAALELLAQGGLHALAMRRIAGALGVQQSALYWYFENKQQILAAVADRLLDAVEPVVADGGAWSEAAIEQASRLRAELRRYPDGAELVATAYAFRLGAKRPFEQFAAVLGQGGAGLASDQADIAAAVLFHFVLGYVTDEQQRRQAAELGAIRATPDPDEGEATRRFAEGVRVIVAGVEARSGT